MNQKSLLLLIILLIAIVVRLVIGASTPVGNDSVLYAQLSEAILHGSLKLDHPIVGLQIIQPGYSLILSPPVVFGLSPMTAGLIISFVTGIASVWLLYLIGKRLWNDSAGLISAAIYAVMPLPIYFSTTVLTESLFTCLLLIIIWLTLRTHTKSSWRHIVILGICIGLAYYVRVVGLALLAPALIWAGIVPKISGKINWKQGFTRVAVLICVVVVIISPYVGYLYSQTGSLLLTGPQALVSQVKQNNTAMNIATPADRQQTLYALDSDGADYAYNNFRETSAFNVTVFVSHFLQNLGHNALSVLLYYIAPLVALGFCVYISIKYHNRKLAWALSFVVSWLPFYMGLYLMGRPHLRYYYPIEPLLYIIVAIAAAIIYKQIRKNHPTFISTLGLMLLSVIVYSWSVAILSDYYLLPGSLYQSQIDEVVGRHVQTNYGAGLTIASAYPTISYFAEARHYPLPWADPQTLYLFAHSHGIEYVLLYAPDNHEKRPILDSLLYQDNEECELVERYKNDFYLYRIK